MSLLLRKSSTQARIEGRNPAIWPDDDYAVVDTDIPVGRIAIVDTDTPVGRIYRELIRGEPNGSGQSTRSPKPDQVVALVTQIVLNMLGIGIGAATLDPVAGDSPSATSFSIGAAIWFAFSGILAALAGGR